MMWIGIVVGLLLGAAFDSLAAAILLAAAGAFVGHSLSGNSADKPDASGSTSTEQATIASLEMQVKSLTAEMRRMAQRLLALEQHVQGDTAMQAPPQAQPEAPLAEAASEAAQAAAAAESELEARRAAALRVTPPVSQTPVSAPAPRAVPDALPPQAASPRPEPVAPVAATPYKPAAPTPSPVPPEPSWLATMFQRWVIGGNPLLKVGVLILFLGLAFLLRYVAENTVVPIEWRYAGVAATGIALLLFGWRWRGREDNYGLILQGAGIGVMYLITLAAMKLHPLIPLQFGFAVLIAVAAFAALLAILQNSLALAVIGTLGGFAAPVLTSTGQAHHISFFTYLSVINIGIVAIAWFKAWRVLNVIGFVCTFALGSAWAAKYYQPEMWITCEPFLLLLFVMYVLITFLFARRTLADAPAPEDASFGQHARAAVSRISYVDGTLAFGVPFATFGLQYLLVRQFEYGAAFSALGFGLVYIVLAFLLFRQSGMRYALLSETMIALAVVFGSLAIPLGLEQNWTSAAWAVEAAGVYWVGIRQQRMHARLFALLLLIGSALYFALGIHVDATAYAVLNGSLLGSVMLAASIWWIFRLLRAAPEQVLHRYENALRSWLLAAGAFFIALLPFLIWPMNWASTALAILGALAVYLAQRWSERGLLMWGCFYQAVAGALYMTTLHATPGGSVLANGWGGLLAVSVIGASMLAGVWAMTRSGSQQEGAAEHRAKAPFGLVASLGLLAGLVFINLAPLFVLPWRFAAMIWPLTGIATLWWAVRVRHAGAIVFALILQVVAGAAYFGSRWFFHDAAVDVQFAKPFLHSGFWGPLLIALAAFVCARLLHKKALQPSDRILGWVALFWAATWWSFALASEIVRVMPVDMRTALLIEIAIISAWLWSMAARRLSWPQLGQVTLAYIPVLVLLAALDWLSPVPHPLAGWGALAWPLALLMHGWLLRRQPAWLSAEVAGLAHTVGAWLFVVVTALELRWQFAQWTSADSAWPLLGWMIAPVVYLWCLCSARLQHSWPLRDQHDAYLVHSALPVAAYLLAWTWITNVLSSGNAAPLPYVTLLNPLEIAQLAILLGVARWWWPLQSHPVFKDNRAGAAGLLGASALAVVTGMVVRTCHHWGQVPWQADALIASSLVQASLSVVWSIVAIGLMMFGNRNRQRWVWIVGAGLIAVVVAKLFMVELAATGSLARIVSFIVVGLLLLLVGYFAPMPPKQLPPEMSAADSEASAV